jgi:hypothetical protein
MDVTALALAFAVGVAVTLVALWLVGETGPRPERPVRISLHSLKDSQESTRRLNPAPPPELKHGGVVGRPRSVFLGEDGEWVDNLHR